MSLGYGCPLKGSCRAKVSSFEKQQYCDSDEGCKRCRYCPMNDGNKEVQRQHGNAVRNHSDAGLGWGLVIVIGALLILGKFFL